MFWLVIGRNDEILERNLTGEQFDRWILSWAPMLEKVYVSPSPLLVGLAKEEKCGVKVSPRFQGTFAWVWQKC